MEDRFVVNEDLNDTDVFLFAVFNGYRREVISEIIGLNFSFLKKIALRI